MNAPDKRNETMGREFIAYNEDGDAVVERIVTQPEQTLEGFAAQYPYFDVAEIMSNREVRTIPVVQERPDERP